MKRKSISDSRSAESISAWVSARWQNGQIPPWQLGL